MTTATAERPTTETTTERFERAPIAQFFESPLNPRKTFDPTELRELAASIQEKDVIEPLVARLEQYAARDHLRGPALPGREAGQQGRPAVVIREYTDAQAIEIMAIENGQRASVPPLEEAEGYKRLLLIAKTYTPAMIATKIGHSERYIANTLRLLTLIPEAQDLLKLQLIGVEHATSCRR
jgi:ParB family chromosome partitioning protein